MFGILLFYFFMELQTSLSALSVVEEPRDMKYWYLFPLMVFVYRPMYSLVRLYSYVAEVLKPSFKW